MAKQEIKQEQVLNVEEAVSRSEAFINKNKKMITVAVVAVVVLVAAGMAVNTWVIKPREFDIQHIHFKLPQTVCLCNILSSILN